MKTSRRMKEIYQQKKDFHPSSLGDIFDFLKSIKKTNFDESVDLHIILSVDKKKHPNFSVRGSVLLPQKSGRNIRVLALLKESRHKEALDAGADYVGSQELRDRIRDGFLDFDVCVTTPDAMGELVAPISSILGPRKLMPTTKNGTVTMDIVSEIQQNKRGKVSYRSDKDLQISLSFGRLSLRSQDLQGNMVYFLQHLLKNHEEVHVKSLKKVMVSSTMGISINIPESVIREIVS